MSFFSLLISSVFTFLFIFFFIIILYYIFKDYNISIISTDKGRYFIISKSPIDADFINRLIQENELKLYKYETKMIFKIFE